MSRFQEFSLGEAIEVAKRNDPGKDVPSVSRVLLAHIDTMTARAIELEQQRDDYLTREWVATKARLRVEAAMREIVKTAEKALAPAAQDRGRPG